MVRLLLSPRWLAAHALVAAVALLLVNLGLWQLRRLEERRAANAVVAARSETPPRPLARLLEEVGEGPSALAFRRVTVSGRYDPTAEVLLTPRADGGEPGHHVLTPLELAHGRALLVDRGWVPFALDRPPVRQAAPPRGRVTVVGLLVEGAEAERYGTLADGGQVTFLSAVDLARLQPQLDRPLLSVWLLLTEQSPPPGRLPRLPPLPDATDEGPHLSYALQWFAFAATGLVGYPLLVRSRLRQAAASSRRRSAPGATRDSPTASR